MVYEKEKELTIYKLHLRIVLLIPFYSKYTYMILFFPSK